MSLADGFNTPDDDARPPDVTPPVPVDPVASAASYSYSAPPPGQISGRQFIAQRTTAGSPAPPPVFNPTATSTAPASTVAPAATNALTAGFDADGGAAWRAQQAVTAATATPAPATAPASSAGDINPDSSVDLDTGGGSTAAPPAASTPSASQAAPVAAPPQATSTLSTNTSGSVDPDLAAMLGGGGDPDADARAQYQRDTTATNKYLKSQGGLTQITPTGQEVPAVDAQGNQLYKAQVINPFVRREDGTAVRVSRDQYGNYHDFNIADGVDGTDFHTDPITGEQFVQVPGADGTSRRETVGQDNYIPLANGVKALQQGHQQDAEQASLAASQAEQGVAGGDGYDGLSVAQLRQSQAAATQGATQAQKLVDQITAYKASGRGLNNTQVNQLQAASDAVQKYTGLAQEQSDALDARQSTITAAQQQRTASMGAVRDAQQVHDQIIAARHDDGSTLTRNLQAVAAGQDVDPAQAKRYAAAGLLAPQPQADGSTALALTDAAKALLPKPDAPPAPAVDPAASLTAPASQFQREQARQTWQAQKQAILSEFPQVGQPGSTASQTFLRAYQRAGNDPRRALQVARAVLSGG